MTRDGSVASAGPVDEASGFDEQWPEYADVYVQSYGLVGTVFGIGEEESGSVLRVVSLRRILGTSEAIA